MAIDNFNDIVGDSGEKAIEPLVSALDRYSTMLDQIAFSLDNVGPTIDKAATSFRGITFSSLPFNRPVIKPPTIPTEPRLTPASIPTNVEFASIPELNPTNVKFASIPELTSTNVGSVPIPELNPTNVGSVPIPELNPTNVEFSSIPELTSTNVEPRLTPALEPTKVAPVYPVIPQTYSKYIPTPPTIPASGNDLRYNPELDIALGLAEPPTKAASTTPTLPPIKTTPTPILSETQAVNKSSIDAISSSLELMGEIVDSITRSMKDMLKNIDLATESVRNFNQKIKDNARQTSERSVENYATAEKIPVATATPSAVGESNREFRESKSVVGGFGRSLLNATVLMKGISLIIERLSVVLSPLAELVSNVLSVFDPFIQTIGKAIQIVANFLGFITKFFTAIFLSPLMRPIQRLLDKLIFLTELLDDLADSMTDYQKAQDTANNIVYGAVRNINSVVRGLVEDPLSAIPALIGQIREAVETFNPGAMVSLDLAMRDLKAVFGEALLPVVTQLTRVLREFANVLRPILIGLAPVFEKLIKSISDLLISNINTLAKAIESLTPIIQDFVEAKLRELKASQEAQKQRDLGDDEILRGVFFRNFNRGFDKYLDGQMELKGLQNLGPRISATGLKIGFGAIKELFSWTKDATAVNEKQMQESIDERFKKIKEIPALGRENIEKRKKLLGEATAIKEELDFAKLRRQFVEKSTPAMRKEAEVVGGEAAYQEALKNLEKGGFKNQGEKDFAFKQFEIARNFLADAMKKAMVGAKIGPAEGLAAPMNPQYKAIAELTRDTMMSAFIATSVSGADQKKQQDDKARNNVAALPQVIEQAVVAAMKLIQEKDNAAPGKEAFGRGVA